MSLLLPAHRFDGMKSGQYKLRLPVRHR